KADPKHHLPFDGESLEQGASTFVPGLGPGPGLPLHLKAERCKVLMRRDAESVASPRAGTCQAVREVVGDEEQLAVDGDKTGSDKAGDRQGERGALGAGKAQHVPGRKP